MNITRAPIGVVRFQLPCWAEKMPPLILLGEGIALVEAHPQVRGMGVHLDLRLDELDPLGPRHVLVVRDLDAGIRPGEAEMLARLGLAVQLARRDVVAHAVHLVVGEPQIAIRRIEVMPDRVANAAREDLALAAIGVHADDPADPDLVVELQLLLRLDVVGLAERDIKLAVRPDPADAGGVVEAFLFGRDQIALRDDRAHGRIGPFKEELGGREGQDAVALGDVQEPVGREAGAVRNVEGQATARSP